MRVIRKPELVTEILMNNVVWVKTGLVWDVLAPLLGEGLILANGAELNSLVDFSRMWTEEVWT